MKTNLYITNILACAFYLFAMQAIAQEKNSNLCHLRITTDPEGATVSINNEKGNIAPLTITDIEPGQHLITAQKKGYNTARKTINIEPGQKVAVDLKLEPVTGLIIIHTDPPGADVQINGADQGKTPLLLTGIAIGRHRAQLTMPGYITKTIDINVESRVPFKISEQLTSDSAFLTLDSTPQGATVIVNGISKGVTPCVIDRLPAGENTIELAYNGFQPYKKTTRLAAGQREQITAVLEPIPSELKIVSIPDKARIYVENQFRGESPVTMQNMKPGPYRIRAELTGYEATARTIELKRAENRVEELRLDGNCGQIQIITEPAGIKVLVDGQPKGTTTAKADETDRVSNPLIIDLIPEGAHKVQLIHKGYHPIEFTLNVERGKTVPVHREMQRRFIPDYEVKTVTETIQGVLVQREQDGSIKLELRPGVFSTIPANKIRSHQPLRTESLQATDE